MDTKPAESLTGTIETLDTRSEQAAIKLAEVKQSSLADRVQFADAVFASATATSNYVLSKKTRQGA
jgi:hypothetical protein